jgi:hypothetical protein
MRSPVAQPLFGWPCFFQIFDAPQVALTVFLGPQICFGEVFDQNSPFLKRGFRIVDTISCDPILFGYFAFDVFWVPSSRRFAPHFQVEYDAETSKRSNSVVLIGFTV